MDDLSRRSLRELLTLARERLGRAAAGLKTRDELLAALRHGDGPAASGPASAPDPAPAPPPARDASPPAAAVVTRDFFVARRSPRDHLG